MKTDMLAFWVLNVLVSGRANGCSWWFDRWFDWWMKEAEPSSLWLWLVGSRLLSLLSNKAFLMSLSYLLGFC